MGKRYYRCVLISKFGIDEKEAEQFYQDENSKIPVGYELLDFLDYDDNLSVRGIREVIALMRIGD